jgi:hypothetical protein
MERLQLKSPLDRTEAYLRSVGYRGYDPYDALKSPLARRFPLRNLRRLRWLLMQVLKRLPVQVRPLLGIRPGYNPVTLALALQAYVYRSLADPAATDRYRSDLDFLVAELERLVSPGYSGACWGYDFPWDAHYASIPAHCPTIVATGFVTNALYELDRHFGDERARQLVLSSTKFLREDLNRTTDGKTFCWSYSPRDSQAVLNATMKGARLCAQASELGAEADLLDLARATIGFVVARQRGDGSWPYAAGDLRRWADNFHTGYVLDCLDEYERITGDTRFQEAKNAGFAFYRGRFFRRDGAARYYDKATYPIDATSCAQAILTLIRFDDVEQAGRVATWTLNHLAKPDGSFKYQIHPWYEIRLTYVRWSVAWLFLALSRLEAALKAGTGARGAGQRP